MADRKMIITQLPEYLLKHLEREWPDRRTLGAREVLPATQTIGRDDLFDAVERALTWRLVRQAMARELVILDPLVPDWTVTDQTFIRAANELTHDWLDALPGERVWRRGDMLTGKELLLCRVHGVAIRALPDRLAQDQS